MPQTRVPVLNTAAGIFTGELFKEGLHIKAAAQALACLPQFALEDEYR